MGAGDTDIGPAAGRALAQARFWLDPARFAQD